MPDRSRLHPASFLLAVLLAVATAGPSVAQPDTPEDLAPGETVAREAIPLRAPVQILSRNGRIETDLYVQFATTLLPGATGPDGSTLDTIWTRAYGLDPVVAGQPLPMLDIPGPTFVYFPGDWLQITLHNQLNKALDPLLAEFEENIPLASQDDIQEPVPHEINIPHNADNTNLHVHGMHVDPKQDDVTLILVPEDDNPSNFTPSLQRFIPDINAWWRWRYGYRLPVDHLPGTHWYHDHKHGATSTHVENGMAGTLLLRPPSDDLAIVPGLWDDDPARSLDTPLVLQEIANFGAQQGAGIQRTSVESIEPQRGAQATDSLTTDWPEITINGQHQPVRAIEQGQTQRWRVVTAGSNHRTSSFLWVGKLTPPDALPDSLRIALESITDFESACPYITIGATCSGTALVTNLPKFEVAVEPFPGTVQMVALDGITLSAPLDLMEQPALLGPGNRVDLVIQPDADAPVGDDYYLIKNIDVAPPLYILARHPAYGDLFADPVAGYWRYLAMTTYAGGTDVVNTYDGVRSSDPSSPFHPFLNLSGDPYALGTDRTSFTQPWPSAVGPDGTPTGTALKQKATVPLLRARPLGSAPSDGMAVDIVGQMQGGVPSGVGWGLPGGAGLVDSQPLMTISVVPGSGGGPQPPTADWMSRISPTTDDPGNTLLTHITTEGVVSTGIPAYVAPITDADVVGQQVVVFDQSGVKFIYEGAGRANSSMQQFSLNGRQFDLDDFVGNPMANQLIEEPVPGVVPNAFVADQPLGHYQYNGGGSFTNQATVAGERAAYFTNPGYYLPVVQETDAAGQPYLTYDYSAADEPPSYAQITGLPRPVQPMATTAEEWILINNSGAFHPFHIHINPLFLTEVGQLNYTGSAWEIDQLDASDELGYVLDNWWDVVIIPPNGYVKFRTWFNIPNQRPRDVTDPDSDFVVDENANVYGSWVYHCHILRHEDRGMMMVVNVRPKPEPASAAGGGASSGMGGGGR